MTRNLIISVDRLLSTIWGFLQILTKSCTTYKMYRLNNAINDCFYHVPCQDIHTSFEGSLVEELDQDSGNIIQLIVDAYDVSTHWVTRVTCVFMGAGIIARSSPLQLYEVRGELRCVR